MWYNKQRVSLNTEKERDTAIDKKERLKKSAKELVPLGLLLVLYVAFFTKFGFGLPCIFRWVTGLKCPGCGMSHALAAMVRLDFGEAAAENILSVTLVPVLALFFIYRFIRYINKGKEDYRVWEIIFLTACALVCVLYFVQRNNLF